VVGSVAYICMCGFLVDWVRLCFGIYVFVCIYLYLVSCLCVFHCVLYFCIFVLLVWWLFDSQRGHCEIYMWGGEEPHSCFLKKFKFWFL